VKSVIEEVLRVIASIWNIGNIWLRRVAIFAIAVPLGMLTAAMLIPQGFAATVIPILALLPVVAIVFLALQKPMVIAAATTAEVGRKAIRAVSLVLAADLVFGVFLSLVPVSNDPGLVPLFVLALVTILLLRIGNAQGLVSSLLTLLAIVLTVIFLIGGRSRMGGAFKSLGTHAANEGVPQAQLVGGYTPNRICESAWNGALDHRNDKVEYFDVKLSPGCWSQFVYLPKTWQNWYHEPIGDTNGWWVSLWYSGRTEGSGPYGPGNISTANFQNVPPILRLQGNGTIRFYSNVAPENAPAQNQPAAEEQAAKSYQVTPTNPSSGSHEGYGFVIEECYRQGEQIKCEGKAINRTDATTRLTFYDSHAVDDEGNGIGIWTSGAQLVFPGTDAIYGNSQRLLPDVPTKFIMTIDDPHRNVKAINLELAIHWGEDNRSDRLVFEGIPVQ